MKGLARDAESVNRRFPFNAELLEFGRVKLRIGAKQGESEFNRARAATLLGFMFLLRVSGLGALELGDITFGKNDDLEYVRIFIRKSKTAKTRWGRSEV